MPMSPRLLRPIASGVHPEAAAWRSAVVANGGSVSASTMRAVSKFCADIDAAGIRDRFYRLNLFAGTGLNACLVPLYRGPSRTGTQYGNTTDTNVGPFVSGDYSETGSTGGLIGNGSSKWLDTGFAIGASDSPLKPNGHISAWVQAAPNSRQTALGVRRDAATTVVILIDRDNSTSSWGGFGTTYMDNVPVGSSPHHVFTQNASQKEWFANGAASSTASAQTPGSTPRSLIVFGLAYEAAGDPVLNRFTGRIGAYSAGLTLTSSQVASYYSAINTFMQALGRV